MLHGESALESPDVCSDEPSAREGDSKDVEELQEGEDKTATTAVFLLKVSKKNILVIFTIR
jgi:hypothetical protein